MYLNFLQLPPAEHRLYFEQIAQRRNLSPVILEKDFWVCWLLAVLFKSPFQNSLVFKGGTSLSKVHGAIERFSEDIDLSVAPGFLQIPEPALNGLSRNQAHKWMNRAEVACATIVRETILPALQAVAVDSLGVAPATAWLTFENDALTNSPVIYFHYPSTLPTGFAYLRRSVKLEFGSLTDQKPVGRHLVQPWLVEDLPAAFPDWQCEVVALELARSFWEKATILHAEYHRPAEKQTPERFSRHYADTAALARRTDIGNMIEQNELRQRVVEWKQCFFGSGWANYDLAEPGSFRLVPPTFRQADLRRDYLAMREMYLNEPPDFDQVLASLADLEQRINRG